MHRRTDRSLPRLAGPFFISVFAVTCWSQARAGEADEARPAAVPNRPTVSTTAALSAPGWLEAELGGLYVRAGHPDTDPVRRTSFPYSLKLAFSENWGVRIDGEAWVRQTALSGMPDTGFGDTSFVVKRRIAIDTDSAFGFEASVTAPTARRGLGLESGKPDYTVNAIYSADHGDWHTDVNLVNTRLGVFGAGEGRWQTLGAASLSRRIDERWGAVGEISGTHRSGASATAQVLGAVTYAVFRYAVIDFGAAHGLNRATPTWQAFAGITLVLGKF